MNKKKFCIANWKMYLSSNESIEFIKEFSKFDISNNSNATLIICPSSFSLSKILDINQNDKIQFGAQNISVYPSGAFTGENSIIDIEDSICNWCIVGHSERRLIFNETNSEVASKFALIYNSKLSPILCVGETIEDFKANNTFDVLEEQINTALKSIDFSISKDILIAYEPVWSIGTGKVADLSIIERNIKFIKNIIKKYNTKNCNLYMLYGGSVDDTNSVDIFEIEDIDGFLIGGASTNPSKFYTIFKSLLRS